MKNPPRMMWKQPSFSPWSSILTACELLTMLVNTEDGISETESSLPLNGMRNHFRSKGILVFGHLCLKITPDISLPGKTREKDCSARNEDFTARNAWATPHTVMHTIGRQVTVTLPSSTGHHGGLKEEACVSLMKLSWEFSIGAGRFGVGTGRR